MQVVVVDLSSDQGKILKAMECALATAKATESRAAKLLAVAHAPADMLSRAHLIYLRAGARVKKLELALERAVGRLESERS